MSVWLCVCVCVCVCVTMCVVVCEGIEEKRKTNSSILLSAPYPMSAALTGARSPFAFLADGSDILRLERVCVCVCVCVCVSVCVKRERETN